MTKPVTGPSLAAGQTTVKWRVDGKTRWPYDPSNITTEDALEPAVWQVAFHPRMGFHLEAREQFALPPKIYGQTTQMADRILGTFDSRPGNTGVLLEGVKGSGKTLLARLVCQKAIARGCPVLLVTQPFSGDSFNDLLNSIKTPKVVLVDEFEKVYPGGSWKPKEDDDEPADPTKPFASSQQALLTLLDGIYHSKTLWVLTANDRFRVDSHMINRPGRLFYSMSFTGLDEQFVREFVTDTLKDQAHAAKLVKMVGQFADFTFDQLQATVEEMNRYDESPAEALRFLNVRADRSTSTYGVALKPLKKKPGFVPALHPGYLTIRLDPYGYDPFHVGFFKTLTNKKRGHYEHVPVTPDMRHKSDPIKGVYVYRVPDENLQVTLTELGGPRGGRRDVGYDRLADL